MVEKDGLPDVTSEPTRSAGPSRRAVKPNCIRNHQVPYMIICNLCRAEAYRRYCARMKKGEAVESIKEAEAMSPYTKCYLKERNLDFLPCEKCSTVRIFRIGQARCRTCV